MIGWLSNLITGGADREVRRLQPVVQKINALELEFEGLSDDALRAKTDEFRRRLGVSVADELGDESAAGVARLGGRAGSRRVETLEDILPEAFAAVREASKRTIGLRHFDVQLIGGMVLHQGRIAEMKTGEGKTLVASLPLYLNALLGKGCHLVTPNDYLSRVGGGWMGPVYHALGISVGVIFQDFSASYDPDYVDLVDHGDERLMHWRPCSRQEAYLADVTYGTNNEFGFDYLRDNMIYDLSQQRQRELSYAIVDEVDSILIDEARTPLIISGEAEEPPDTYYKFARIVDQLREGEHYTVDLKLRSVLLTEEGIDRVERLAGVANIYDEQNYYLVHYLEQALKAKAVFHRDREYVLMVDGRVLGEGQHARNAEIVIVDEFTGRIMAGRRYSEGLHQAIEAKENVEVKRENLTVAEITFQNYFRLYQKLAGMTGTAATEAEEFRKIYNLEVSVIPTHRPMVRDDYADLIYKNTPAKLDAIVDEIEELHEDGRPILVGTTSVEKSEYLSQLLTRRGVPHQVLNAKYHEREAAIVVQAGRKGAVTIATNMAGRGTDIILGGNPPDPDEAQEVRQLGGLHILGTERHEARRIDNQLRGRAGRQGDPGSSRFYLALDDDLMRRFGSDRIAGLMDRMGLEDDQPIEHPLVSKSIETAQQKVEGFNFDARKYTVEYDDVMNKQRTVIYAQRRRILEAEDVRTIVLGVVGEQLARLVEQHTDSPRPEDRDLEGLFNAVASMLGPELLHEPEELEGENKETLQEVLSSWAEELYAAKEQMYSPELMQYAARGTLLRIIDTLWMEHLTAMDDMKAGIGLRAFGQRDPLTEYKQEGYRLFETLLKDIQLQLCNAIFRVQFVAEPMPGAAPAASPNGGSAPAGMAVTSGANGAAEYGTARAGATAAGAADGSSGVEPDGLVAPAEMGAGARTAGDGTAPGASRSLNPALARRVAALTQPPAPMRRAVTNEAPLAEPVGRRSGPGGPRGVSGTGGSQDRPMTRAERNKQEELAKRQKKRELKRARQQGR